MRLDVYSAIAACCKFVGIVALLALGASDFGCEAFTSSVIVVPHGERSRFSSCGPKHHVARVEIVDTRLFCLSALRKIAHMLCRAEIRVFGQQRLTMTARKARTATTRNRKNRQHPRRLNPLS